ncbi:hypothetical protein [Clostridium tertium]|uniref:hypothetical protein n=1 Tax=Clostridium tertium TaxID=1559 RepID=UPI00374F4C57
MELLITMLLLIALGVIIFGIITYVFMGLSLSGAAEVEEIEKKWFAWVPILNIIILLKLGNKDARYIWVFIGAMIASFLTESSSNGFLLIINLALFIWTIVIQIQVYLCISNKYKINPAWFIIGIFILPISLVAYILFYNKVKRIKEVLVI